MKLWTVVGAGWENTYISSIWDDETRAHAEAAALQRTYNEECEAEGLEHREYVFYVSSRPYLLNEREQ